MTELLAELMTDFMVDGQTDFDVCPVIDLIYVKFVERFIRLKYTPLRLGESVAVDMSSDMCTGHGNSQSLVHQLNILNVLDRCRSFNSILQSDCEHQTSHKC